MDTIDRELIALELLIEAYRQPQYRQHPDKPPGPPPPKRNRSDDIKRNVGPHDPRA